MKIVFMGTPEFSVPTLSALAQTNCEIGYVITQPDKARDRGKKIQPTPVKECAQALNIEVLQPEKVKGNSELFALLGNFQPDLIVVIAYGKILPVELLKLPRLGCINVHASLLPKYRGAAPIQRSILEGDAQTGVTLMYMEEGLDTGDMIAVSKTDIDKKNAESLHDELSQMGAKLLVETLPAIEAGEIVRIKQNDALATYAPMIFKSDGLIDFSKGADAVERLIRGLYPWPGAYTYLAGETFKIWEAIATDEKNEAEDGTVTAANADGIAIASGGKTLLATVVQVPGKKKMRVDDYLKGKNIEKYTHLG